MKTICKYLVIAFITAVTLTACNDSADPGITPDASLSDTVICPAKTGNLLIDLFNLEDFLIGKNFYEVRHILTQEGWRLQDDWRLQEYNDYYPTYFYAKPNDSLQIDLSIELGLKLDVIYVSIDIFDPHFWDDGSKDYFADSKHSMELIQHIGNPCTLLSGTVCHSCGYHSYDGAFDNDGDDYASLLRDFNEYWGLRYFETDWMSKDEHTFITFGSFYNACDNNVSISITSPSLLDMPISFW